MRDGIEASHFKELVLSGSTCCCLKRNSAYCPLPHCLAAHNHLNGFCFVKVAEENSMKFAKRIGQLWKGLTPILVTGAGFR